MHVLYGRIEALKGLSFTVDEGEIVTLIGANGAGKTTTLKAITGVRPVSSGHGHVRRSRHHPQCRRTTASQLGICQAPEGRGIFPGMTVIENLEMGTYIRKDRKSAAKNDRPRARLHAVPPPARNASRRPAAPCPAASSRCWRSAAR